MLPTGTPTRRTTTGSFHTGPGVCYGISLTAAAAAASATIRLDGSGGTVVVVIKAAVETTAVWFPPCGVHFSDLHVTLAGTGAEATALI